jgi:nitroreductase
MELVDLIKKRRMVRSFTDEPVAVDAVERILDCARRGPSAGYSQGVEFVVVTDASKRNAIAAPGDDTVAVSGHHNFVAQAAVHVVICVSDEIYRSRYRESDKMRVVADIDEDDLWKVPFWYVDAGAALMLLLLATVDEGLAAAFTGGHDPAFLQELLAIPPEYIPVGIALLGHEAPDARQFGDVSADQRRRRPLSEVVHHESW